MTDEIPYDDAAFMEITKDGVVHRVPVTPEQARRFFEDGEAIGHARGEPMVEVDEDGEARLVEHHGLPEDPDAEPVEPNVLGEPIDPEKPLPSEDEDDEDDGSDLYPDEP